MNYYLKVLQNYTNFTGRARRKEYWCFVLFNILAVIVLSILDSSLGTVNVRKEYGLLSSIYIVLVIVPSIAVAVRRLHDIGRSGWWFLLNFLPLLGSLILFVFFILDSQPETNQYGENPKLTDFS